MFKFILKEIRDYWHIGVSLNPNVRLLLLSGIFAGINASVLDIIFNLYFNSLKMSGSTIGIINALPAVIGLIVGIPAGLFCDRIGRRFMLIFGNIGLSLMYLLVFIIGNNLLAI